MMGDKTRKVRPFLADWSHRVLTNEVWHQTSMCKDTKISREESFLFPTCRKIWETLGVFGK